MVFRIPGLLNLPWLKKVAKRFFDKMLSAVTRLNVIINLQLCVAFGLIVLTVVLILTKLNQIMQ